MDACCTGPDRCGVPGERTDTRKVVSPKWIEEQDNCVKTSLQGYRGVVLTDSPMSNKEALELEKFLDSTPNTILFM